MSVPAPVSVRCAVPTFKALALLKPIPPLAPPVPAVTEMLPLVALSDAVRGIHFPDDLEDLRRAYRRLVFDEFFALELAVEMKKAELQKENHLLSHSDQQHEMERWMASLDFEMTTGQKAAIENILSDMKSGRVMHRLVQGDVGSGKTVVAAAALYFTALNGYQGALMAPT